LRYGVGCFALGDRARGPGRCEIRNLHSINDRAARVLAAEYRVCMGFIPVGDLMRELILAIGGALLIGNLAVVIRERRRKPEDVRPKPNWTIVGLNVVLGIVLTVWGLGSILAAR
jgi:hypothetical protein